MKYLVLTLACLFVAISVSAQKKSRKKVTYTQGICGTVVIKRGNFMPSPDRPTQKGQPIEREVLIFPLLNMSQVEAGEPGFIRSVKGAKPVKTIKSDKDGKFCISLPVGKYSVIVREPEGLYANLYDTESNIFPVTVQKNQRTAIKVEINHQAVF